MRQRPFLFFLVILFALCTVSTFAGEDYYKILGVPRNADQQAIRKAFKKLSLKYHPDKNKGKEDWAREQYVKVANAYETLSDAEKRNVYDRGGEEGVRNHEQGKAQGGGFHGASHEDIFGHFFGGRHGGGGGGFQFNFGGGGGGFHHQQQQQQPQHENLWDQSDVFELTINDISMFYRREQVWMILFYKSDQPESKQYKDTWRELAEKLYGIIKVAAINCHADKEDALCEEFSVYETPKVIAFPASITADGITYNGEIKYSALAGFATSFMESFVRLVTDENYDLFSKEDFDKNKVLLFTARKSTPPLLKALSKEYKGRLVFGEVRQSSKQLVQKYKITKFPTIIVVADPSSYEGIVFEGEFKHQAIVRFLREFAYATKQKAAPQGSGKLVELTSRMIEDGKCGKPDDKLCFLYISKKRDNEQNLIQAISDFAPKYSNDPINFYIIDSNHISYTDSFADVSAAPAVVIIKGKGGRYVKFGGDLEGPKVKDFVDFVVSGSAMFKKLKQSVEWENKNADEL